MTGEVLNDEKAKTKALVDMIDSATDNHSRQIEELETHGSESHTAWQTWFEETQEQRDQHRVSLGVLLK